MKKNFLSIIMMLFAIVTFNLLLASCNSDPNTPIDETEHHDHDEPHKAILTLVQGHFHGGNQFHQEAEREGVKYLKAAQTITFTHQEGIGWAIDPTSPKQFVAMAGTQSAPVVYGLKIQYFDAHGHEVTGEFVENGQDKIHQHFFMPSNIKALTNGGDSSTDNVTAPNLFQYTYLDTNPWNGIAGKNGTTITGGTNPVGIKGWFNFLTTYKKFELDIWLMHAQVSKFVNGTASPYYAPTANQLALEHFDIKMKVPVVIINSKEQAAQWQSANGTDFSQLNANEKIFIQAMAEAYNITPQECLTDWYQYRLRIEKEESGEIRF